MGFFSSLSGGARLLFYGGAALAAAGVATAFYPQIWWIMLLGLAVVALLLLVFKLVLTMRDRKRGKDTNAKVLSAAQGGGGVTDATDQAALDDLQKKFTKGVDTLDSMGLDLYALPWFVIVGQPASGKTEAIRRCKIPFPPGLTDELQGTGGTVNMDWWFTNDAVILDTAGKMLFQEAGQGTSEEWVKFLKLVREARPHCPINGMLLVIPADSLISDSPEQLEQNAKTIAAQLTLIQRTLGVRFPVFTLITKCDLITGFREFFDTLDDRKHQQMLGWSNPDPLDTPFDPAKVRSHLATVRKRLEKMRFQLLQDPVGKAGANGKRLDEVDRLYDFPAALQNISEPLQKHLEIIFSGSKLAPKPLFLRGIYFTSSIQKGSILDGVLAQAMGVSLDRVTESKPFERVRPLFLRDLFMEKIFPESGLVTRADNTVKLKARRKLLVLGSVAIGALLLLGLSLLGFRTFQKSVGDQGELWTAIAQTVKSPSQPSLVVETSPGSGVYLYNGDRDPLSRTGDAALDELPSRTLELAEAKIDVPVIFQLTSGLSGNLLSEERQQAHRKVIQEWVSRPLASVAAERLGASRDMGSDPATAALAQLVRMRTYRAGQTPAGPPATLDGEARPGSPLDIEALLRYALAGQDNTDALDDLDERKAQLEQLQRVIDASFVKDSHLETLGGRVLEGQVTDDQLTAVVRRYLDAQMQGGDGEGGPVQQINRLTAELLAFEQAEDQLHLAADMVADGRTNEAVALWSDWTTDPQKGIVGVGDRIASLLASLSEQGYDMNADAGEVYQKAIDQALDRLNARVAPLQNQLPAPKKSAALDAAKDAVPGSDLVEAGLDALGDPYPRSLRTLIDQRASAYRKTLLEQSAQAQGDLDRLMKKYILQTRKMRLVDEGEPNRPAALLASMYNRTASFNPDLPDALTLSDLAPAIGAIDKTVAEIKDQVQASARLAEPDSAVFERAMAKCERMLDVRARINRSELVRRVASGTEDADAIKRSVAQYAADYQDDEGKWQTPRIPLSRGFDPAADQPFKINPQYHPEGLRQYLGNWNAVIGSLDTERLQQTFADPDEVAAALKNISNTLNPYFRDYLDYWTDEVVAASGMRAFDDWEAYRQAIGGIRVTTVQIGLDALAEQIEAAAGVVPLDALEDEAQSSYKAKIQRALARVTATGQTRDIMIGAAEEVLRHWQNVNDLASEVDRIRQSSPASLQSKFLTDLYLPERSAQPTVQYWSDFTLTPLTLAADAGGREYRQAQTRLNQDFQVFPLFNRELRQTQLNTQQLRDAAGVLAVLAGGTATDSYPEGSIGAGSKLADNYEQINDILSRLRGWTDRTEAEEKKIQRLAQITKALSAKNGLKVNIVLPSEKTLKDKAPAWAKQRTPAYIRYTRVDVAGQSFNADAPRAVEDLSIRLPDDALTITFIRQDPAAGSVKAEVKYDKPWSAIHAVLPFGKESEVTVDQDGVYWVPFELPPKPGDPDKYYYMIGLKFAAPLPTPADWPKR